MEWEHRNWYSFVWICGDQMVEQHFHNIDFMNWVMGAHPVRVVASGGAAWRPRERALRQIYDHMASDFVYPNGVHLSSQCRQYPKRHFSNVSDLIVGTKGRSTAWTWAPRESAPTCRSTSTWWTAFRPRAVHQPSHAGRRKHADLHHGARIGLFGHGDHLGPDREVASRT